MLRSPQVVNEGRIIASMNKNSLAESAGMRGGEVAEICTDFTENPNDFYCKLRVGMC